MASRPGRIPCRIAKTVQSVAKGGPEVLPSPVSAAASCVAAWPPGTVPHGTAPRVASGVPGEPVPADLLSAWTAATHHPPDHPPRRPFVATPSRAGGRPQYQARSRRGDKLEVWCSGHPPPPPCGWSPSPVNGRGSRRATDASVGVLSRLRGRGTGGAGGGGCCCLRGYNRRNFLPRASCLRRRALGSRAFQSAA